MIFFPFFSIYSDLSLSPTHEYSGEEEEKIYLATNKRYLYILIILPAKNPPTELQQNSKETHKILASSFNFSPANLVN